MKDFELVGNNISYDLYEPKGTNITTIQRFGKVALILFCSTSLPQSDLNANTNTFSIEQCSSKHNTDEKSNVSGAIINLLSDKDHLVVKLAQLPYSTNWKEFDMTRPSETIIDNSIRFVKECPKISLLANVHVFPRPNGTVLLKWNNQRCMASVNIGTSSFSYAIMLRKSGRVINDEGIISNSSDISKFYDELYG